MGLQCSEADMGSIANMVVDCQALNKRTLLIDCEMQFCKTGLR